MQPSPFSLSLFLPLRFFFLLFFFFFFQAEDGIRDKLVTGVQTCALPIYQAFQSPNFSEFFLSTPAGAPITAFTPLENALAPFLGGQTLGLRSIPLLARGKIGRASCRERVEIAVDDGSSQKNKCIRV